MFQVTKNVYPVEENMLDVWCDVRASDFAWNVVILFEIEVKVVVVVLTKIYSIKMVTSYEIAVKLSNWNKEIFRLFDYLWNLLLSEL